MDEYIVGLRNGRLDQMFGRDAEKARKWLKWVQRIDKTASLEIEHAVELHDEHETVVYVRRPF